MCIVCGWVGFEFKLYYRSDLKRETKILLRNSYVMTQYCRKQLRKSQILFIFSSSLLCLVYYFVILFFLNWKTCFCGTFKSTLLFFFLFTTCGDRFTRTRRDVLVSSRLDTRCLFFNIPNATDLKIFKCWRIIAISAARNSNPSI